LSFIDGELQLEAAKKQGLKLSQELVYKYADNSLSDKLIKDRKEENKNSSMRYFCYFDASENCLITIE